MSFSLSIDKYTDKKVEGAMDCVKSESEGDKSLIQQELHMPYLVHPGLNVQPTAEDTTFFASSICPAPICRQFWKAGNYNDEFVSRSRVQS